MLENLYNEMTRRGLVRSRAALSTKFLGRARNYCSDRNCPSVDALANLHHNLMKIEQYDLAVEVLIFLFDNCAARAEEQVRR